MSATRLQVTDKNTRWVSKAYKVASKNVCTLIIRTNYVVFTKLLRAPISPEYI